MSSGLLETYRHSGKFNPPAVLLPLIAAVVLGFPLGFAYAYLIRWIPFVYINFIITLGYGFTFGWGTGRLLKAGHVRNTTLAASCGIAVGIIALYAEWNGHLHAVFDDAPWFFRPDQMLNGMALLYQEGSWSFHGQTVTGPVLAACWLIEAGLIVGVAASIPWAFVRDTPYCEKARCWLDEQKAINTLEPFTDEARIAALRSGDLMPLVDAKAKPEGAAVFTRLLLKRSPQRTTFCTLRIQNVSVSIDSEGKVKERAENFTGDLILPASMFDLITRFEEFKPLPPASVPA